MMFHEIYNEDFLASVDEIPDGAIDLIVADPPYGLGKDFGNDSDKMKPDEVISWTQNWIKMAIPKLNPVGSMYVFATWKFSPEIFSLIKREMIMVNEIIWDRCVPSMGGSTRSFTSVHDNIGFFVRSKGYYFDLDAVRVPYDEKTKKARTRSIFVGKKWLELGHNPKDLWSVSRLHGKSRERKNHPTQKPMELIERMVKASCPEGGVVLDPFAGSGTTLEVCKRNGRNCIGFEINPEYVEIARERLG